MPNTGSFSICTFDHQIDLCDNIIYIKLQEIEISEHNFFTVHSADAFVCLFWRELHKGFFAPKKIQTMAGNSKLKCLSGLD